MQRCRRHDDGPPVQPDILYAACLPWEPSCSPSCCAIPVSAMVIYTESTLLQRRRLQAGSADGCAHAIPVQLHEVVSAVSQGAVATTNKSRWRKIL